MTETLETGSLRPRNINRTFGICYKLSTESGSRDRKHFIAKIRGRCESYIFANQNSMFVQNLCDDRFISYVYLYSEIASVLQSTLHPDVINFFFSFLHVVGNKQQLTGEKIEIFLLSKLFPVFESESNLFFISFSSK